MSTLADVAGGLSSYTDISDPEHSCVTIEMKINFIKPANTDLLAVGKLLKANRSMMVSTA